MKRPLADKRPLGPFAQANAHEPGEVAIYFEMSNLADIIVDGVEDAVSDMTSFDGPVSGPHGVSDNVVSVETVGNQTTHSELMELMSKVEDETGVGVEDVEVIW